MAAYLSAIMLHGDGSYFVFALVFDEPWILKWRDISTRVSTYLFTVVPMEFLIHALKLTPLEIARTNGFVFYFVPALQYAVAMAIVWRRYPEYLAFPVVQYALSASLGYGYPSEVLLAPGFLWIALFLILTQRTFTVWFVLCFCALVFSHELALPSAIVVAVFALRVLSAGATGVLVNRKQVILLTCLVSIFALLFITMMGGGIEGSRINAIYVIDPRRVFNNPTLWLMIGVLPLVMLMTVKASIFERRVVFTLTVVVVTALPLMLQLLIPSLDFEQSRYDTARTFVGGAMFVLAILFICTTLAPAKRSGTSTLVTSVQLRYGMVVALALSFGSSAAFLRDWSIGYEGFKKIVASEEGQLPLTFVSYTKARLELEPRQRRIYDRLGFHWVLPFRSVVLADGELPQRIVYSDMASYRLVCSRLSAVPNRSGASPDPVFESIRRFACTHVATPTPPGPFRRFMGAVRKFFQ